MTPQLSSRMRAPINSARFWPPLPLVQGERIACRAVVLRRREVRGSETARALKPQTLTLLSPLGRETRTKTCHTASARLYSMTSARNLGACGSPLPLLKGERMEVRGSEIPRQLNSQTLTLPSPLGRERRINTVNVSNKNQTRSTE